MYKLLLIVLMMGVWLAVHLLQIEEEMAMQTLFQGKYAVNRAAHAAAQQLDMTALGNGMMQIEESAAAVEAARYLQRNLQLDAAGNPLPGSWLKHRVEVVAFEVINPERGFPYTYRNAAYDYEVTLHRPGVVIVATVIYPRAFTVLDEIQWYIKGAAELTTG
jgi:hypothetical protein